jgi:enamine deaminase RidA (YjgF/YER057c/UK114 family)
MTTTRYGSTDPDGGMPIISKVVQHGGLVYLCGVTPDPEGDIQSQTRQVLHRIDRLLAELGSDKSNVLSATVWLSDMNHYPGLNVVWNNWVDPAQPPVRACVEARLSKPGLLVEIMVTAAQ